MRKKVAVVIQRYGNEVNGGAESYAKKLSEHLQPYYDIEVLTTTALDYDTWTPHYREGTETVDGVAVRRFRVEKTRDLRRFTLIDRLLCRIPALCKLWEPIWLNEQGPYCPEMITYIREHQEEYDSFIFVTYLYYPTVKGLPEVREKALFVPTAHDEYCIYFSMFRPLFKDVKGMVYLTEEEQQFVQKLFGNETVPHCVAGSGIDFVQDVKKTDFSEKMLPKRYVIYIGRVDISKNCDKMFVSYLCYRQETTNPVELVVIGKMMMEKPENPHIHCLGFVSEDEKYEALSGAAALIMPSEHESLSLVALEAMALGIPVIVNGKSAVLNGHCQKSGGGIAYEDYDSFKRGLELLMSDTNLREQMGCAGKRYVKDNYNWDKTVEKYRQLIERRY